MTHEAASRTPQIHSVPAGRRWVVLLQAGALVLAIAFLDWRVNDAVPLGWLYLLPMALAATVLPRLPLLLLALACTVLAEVFDGYDWDWISGLPRDVLYFSAFAGAALFVSVIVRSRQSAAEHLRVLEEEMAARRDAEEQLRVLVENSPVAVFTADAEGHVLLANQAADTLFGLPPGDLAGRSFAPFLPPLLDLPSLHAAAPGAPAFRTAMQCRGHRASGEIFQADVWFSTYGTETGPRLAVFVADGSENLRDREEASLHQLLAGSRILFGAVSHEVRNVCAAIAMVHENLRRSGALAGSEDFQALGTLVQALERIASVELRGHADQLSRIDLNSLLEEMQIIIAPALREDGIALHWRVPATLPRVWADRQSLMQVLLNLFKNAQHVLTASRNTEPASITLSVEVHPGRVIILVKDTGPGVPNPAFLFKPFQEEALATGLGLYLSRAMMRSFSGDLSLRPGVPGEGATFAVDLLVSEPEGNSL